MNDISSLLNVLTSASDLSSDALVLLSPDLNQKTSVLDDFGIIYESQTEGVRIDLSIQNIRLYKTKIDAVKHLGEQSFDKAILIFEDNVAYRPEATNNPTFFENIIYWYSFRSLIINNEISAHDDELTSRLIFLSENLGKLEVGYKREMDVFFDQEHALKENYISIKEKIEEDSEFISFFRDNFFKVASGIDSVDRRFTESLQSINRICENSQREFNLYKNKFSFDTFKSKLDDEKEAYLKEYQSNLSSFLLTVGSLPIQFGVYVYLILRFELLLFPLVAVLLLILAWSLFSFFSIKQIKNNIDYIKESVESQFSRLLELSGFTENDIEPDRGLILSRFSKTRTMLTLYQWLISVFTFVILVIGISLVNQLLCSQ